MPRFRDTFKLMAERVTGRRRFGDDEMRCNDSARSDLVDIELELRAERPSGVAVSHPAKLHKMPWVWLPRPLIEIEKKSANVVVVTMPMWLAKDRGLV